MFLPCLPAVVAYAAVSPPPVLPVAQTGDIALTGFFLNADGVLVVPTPTKPGKDWTVTFEGERYPATVLSVSVHYGITFLRVSRQKPFPITPLSDKQAVTAARLRVWGLPEGGPADAAMVGYDAAILRVRRRVPEQGRDGSYYEANVIGGALASGAVLFDPETGVVFGLTLPPATGSASPCLILHSSTIRERLASENLVVGAGEPPRVAAIQYDGGRTASTPIRSLEFRSVAAGRENARNARALQEWRRNTGFWVNTFTSPRISGANVVFGATNGVLYCVDLATMQREWVFENKYPMFFPPTVGTSRILTASGVMFFQAVTEASEDFSSFLTGMPSLKSKRHIYDGGVIACVDKESGVFRWEHESHFPSQPVIVGDKVVYGGLDVIGVLNLADGKPVWEKSEQGGDANARYYTIAGADSEKVWTMAMPTKLTGSGTRREPFRLEQDGGAVLECVSLDIASLKRSGKLTPLWSIAVPSSRSKAALAGTLLMSANHKFCYGTTAREVFAADAEAGKLLWHHEIFTKGEYAGTTVIGDQFLYCTTSDNEMIAISRQDGSVAWTFKNATAPLSVPLVSEGIVYVGSMDTHVYALDARTGQLIWKYETNGKVCGEPYIAGDKLYVMSDDGKLSEIALPK